MPLASCLLARTAVTYVARMTRMLLTTALLVVSFLSAVAATSQKIAFERGDSIWVANADGSDARKIVKGSAPDLSRDGKRIAFHTDESRSKDLVRQIATADVATKQVKIFKNEIPSRNCQRAIWSPDGAHILFT